MCAAEVAVAGGGCVVIVTGIDHVSTMMIASNSCSMAFGIGDISLHLIHFCVMSHSTTKWIHSLSSTVALLLFVLLACNCSQ